ncbi:MAG: (Fe-S)-binding protein [Chitinophagaceae bacterium]|nr:(Fe-S)-binding protein [Chitinophagaceae bacterium]
MEIIQQLLFLILASVAIYFFAKNIIRIRRNIFLGKKENLNDNKSARWRNVIMLALGQKKMFKNPLVAVLHLIVYAGFIIINIEIVEIILDGILGTHRLFAPIFGGFYNFLINSFEILAALVLIACIIFIFRRVVIKVKRLSTGELSGGWPQKDALIILGFEIVLMSLFLKMNAADQVLQIRGTEHYTATSPFVISQYLTFFFENFSTSTLIFFERLCWWLHIIGIFAFMNYLVISKHLHIILAFPNAFYASLLPAGKMTNMPEVQNEIKYMMQPELAPTTENAAPPSRFGAKDVLDLSWKNLLDAYACTECGRCTSACPANQTGKKLSPRKIMMDTRDRIEEVGKNLDQKGQHVEDGKTLLNDYITVEELRACTTCNACVEECPVSISPLSIIMQLRRSLIMEDSNAPQEWNAMFSNIENNMAPWKFSADDRDAWVN